MPSKIVAVPRSYSYARAVTYYGVGLHLNTLGYKI